MVEVANLPPGSGKHLVLDDEASIRRVYAPIPADGHRHNAANTSIVVDDDLAEAQLTSYLVTTIARGDQGGVYGTHHDGMQPRCNVGSPAV